MTQYSWNDTATGLAQEVRQRYANVKRGVVPLRFIDDSTLPPSPVNDAPLMVGVFGNDSYLWDEKMRQELNIVRERLGDLDANELGFGLSADGQTWALLI